jgi:hypothetical protein
MQNEPELTQKIARMRRRLLFTGLFVFLLGCAPLGNSIDNPHLVGLRGPDVLRIFAVGWCFGIGATLLAGSFTIPRIDDGSWGQK